MGDPITQTILATVGLKNLKGKGKAAPVPGGPPGTMPGSPAPIETNRRRRGGGGGPQIPTGAGTSLLI